MHDTKDEPEQIMYYLKTGTCKFGATCKFHHPKDKAGIAGRVTLNLLGYPLRANESECAYYMRTGQCKFGTECASGPMGVLCNAMQDLIVLEVGDALKFVKRRNWWQQNVRRKSGSNSFVFLFSMDSTRKCDEGRSCSARMTSFLSKKEERIVKEDTELLSN